MTPGHKFHVGVRRTLAAYWQQFCYELDLWLEWQPPYNKASEHEYLF